MLYPANVWVWWHVGATLGLKPNGPLQFFSSIELMNCFAGAACLAILYSLMSSAISSRLLVLGATVGYGFSRAFLVHATNAAEPLVGVLWSFLAISFAALSFKVKSIWPIVATGFLFVLAAATYQSTILLAPSAVVLIWRARSENQPSTAAIISRFQAIGIFALSGLFGCVLLYGLAYRLQGVVSPSAMLRRFLVLETARAYFGTGIGKVLNVPIGMIRNTFPVLVNYSGIRNLMAGPKLSLLCFILLLAGFCALLGLCFVETWNERAVLSPKASTGFAAAGIGLVFTAIPLLIWEPNYDKLWLQPLACLAFLVAISMDVVARAQRKKSRFVVFTAIILSAGVTMSNSIWAIERDRKETAGMQGAQSLSASVERRDLIVGDWDNISILYAEIWANEGQFMDFTSEGVSYGRDATDHLRDAVLRTNRIGGRVYFLGVVDMPREAWDAFMGSRCGVPFSDLDFYRANTHVVSIFRIDASQVSLWQLDAK